MILNFRQLEVFRAVMIAKTVSGAAELLHVSQPGISRLLKHMEYKLGIDLFERHKGRLIPTPEGKELFDELESIYQRVEDLDVVINRITRPDNMQFQIACTPSLSSYIIPRLIALAKKKMPALSIKLECLSNEEIADHIVQRRVDFGLAFYDSHHPLIQAEPSISVRMECIVPQDHPLAQRESVEFSDLLDYDLITYYSETLLGSTLDNAFQKLKREPTVSVVVRYADDACSMVQQGLGVTVAFEYTAMNHRFPGLKSIPINGENQRLHFLRHNGIAMSNNVRKFYELAKAEIRALGD